MRFYMVKSCPKWMKCDVEKIWVEEEKHEEKQKGMCKRLLVICLKTWISVASVCDFGELLQRITRHTKHEFIRSIFSHLFDICNEQQIVAEGGIIYPNRK